MAKRDRRRGNILYALLGHKSMPRPRHAPEGPDLEVDVGPFCVDGVYDLGMQIQNQQNHETIANCQMTMSSVLRIRAVQ